MKKFSFELEDLLKIRNFETEQAQIELGKVISEQNKIKDALNTLAIEHTNAKKSVSGLTNFSEIANIHQYYKFLKLQEQNYLEQLAQLEIVIEEKRNIFKEKLQKSESLKKLKEKHYEAYKELENKEDEDNADEIVTAKGNKILG